MGQDLHLNRGKSSKSLLDVGGQGLMAEIETRYPNGVKHGEVATISGGSLQCQELYLGYLPGWKDGNGKVCILEKYYGKLQGMIIFKTVSIFLKKTNNICN